MIKKLIDSAVIVSSLRSDSKDDVLDEVLAALVAAGRLSERHKKIVRAQLDERESLGSTGIGNGIAVPHVKSPRLDELSLALARSADGIPYEAIDGQPVHTLFLILAPESRAEDHLLALRWVSSLARSADFRRFVMAAEDEAEIRALLLEMSPLS
jgi:mannitol/fructose-specific phosphotransferase system IIA component (Ntr-type)